MVRTALAASIGVMPAAAALRGSMTISAWGPPPLREEEMFRMLGLACITSSTWAAATARSSRSMPCRLMETVPLPDIIEPMALLLELTVTSPSTMFRVSFCHCSTTWAVVISRSSRR